MWWIMQSSLYFIAGYSRIYQKMRRCSSAAKKVKNVKCVFTESHPEQHELVTTRQMENWHGMLISGLPDFLSPSEPQSITPPTLLMMSDRLTSLLFGEFS